MSIQSVKKSCVIVTPDSICGPTHPFIDHLPEIGIQTYHVSPVLAGYISALMPLVVVMCAPIAGLILDRWGRQLYVLLMANIVTIVAYILLLQVREEVSCEEGRWWVN